MKLINMAMSKEEAREYSGTLATPEPNDLPKYPYGLCLHLDDDALEKLGLSTMPKVGDTMMATVMLEVTGTSTNERQGGDEEACVDLQITAMALGDEDESTAPAKRDPAKALYKE